MGNTAPIALVTGPIDETVTILLGRDRIWILRMTVFLSTFLIWWPAARLPAASESNEAQIVIHFRAGQQATQLGQFERAVEEYKKVLNLDPNLLEARVNLGLAYHSLGQYSLAVSELSRALRQRPQLLGPHIILGIDYLKLGFPEKAIPPLQRALSIESSNREARRALAACYLAQDNYLKATNQYRELFSLSPEMAEAWFALGHDYLDISARLTTQMARNHPDSAWGVRLAGDLLAERGDWNDAAQDYRKALATDARQPGLHVSLGRAYLGAEKFKEAEAEFRRELELDPKDEQTLLGMAEMELARGNAVLALEKVAQVWEISPEFLALQQELPSVELAPDLARKLITDLQNTSEGPAKHFLLSSLYRVPGELQRTEEHRTAFQSYSDTRQRASADASWEKGNVEPCQAHQYAACIRVLQSRKNLGVAERRWLGKSQLAMRDYGHAADTFAGVLSGEKDSEEATYWLVRTYQKLAAESFDRVDELSPDSWRAHELRAESYKLRQAFNDAIRELTLAIQLQPNEVGLHEGLGDLYLTRNLFEQARAELEKSLALEPARSRSLFLLGRLYVRQRESEKAIPYLQKALRYQPDLIEASAALGTAYLRLGQAASAVPELMRASPYDYYGDVHYQLYLAYRKLGKGDLARKALAGSQELRRKSAERHQAKVAGAVEVDSVE
jgi:tetratricopeptide (TPR) repeat protein